MKNIKSLIAVLAAACMSLTLFSGCSTPSYDGFSFPEKGESTLKLVSSDKYYTDRDFSGKEPTVEKTVRTVSSENGFCTIDKKTTYYEVTLDLEKGNHREIGTAYADAILKVIPDYPETLEGYLYESIKAVSPKEMDYRILVDRFDKLKSSLDKDYQDELEAYGEKISGGLHGFEPDGKLSAEEAMITSMVPDSLRATACSVMSADGSKTQSGHRIASRILEWDLGSKNQLSRFHCLVHYKNGKKSFNAVGLVGMFDVLTGVNDDGVMTGLLDVGSKYGEPFIADGKTCYSYDLRKVMEEYSSAKEGAKYLASRSDRYTYNCNLFVSDDKDALAVEAVVDEMDGETVIRDSKTELLDGVAWSDPGYFCIVNSFVAKNNADRITRSKSNIIRWRKYDRMFADETDKISLTRFKEKMTSEKIKDSPIENIRSATVVHMVVMDFDTHKAQALFSGGKDPDDIQWIDLGKMY